MFVVGRSIRHLSAREVAPQVSSGIVLQATQRLPLKDHPGGKKAIMLYAGKDATEEFEMLHPPKVIKKYGIFDYGVAIQSKNPTHD